MCDYGATGSNVGIELRERQSRDKQPECSPTEHAVYLDDQNIQDGRRFNAERGLPFRCPDCHADLSLPDAEADVLQRQYLTARRAVHIQRLQREIQLHEQLIASPLAEFVLAAEVAALAGSALTGSREAVNQVRAYNEARRELLQAGQTELPPELYTTGGPIFARYTDGRLVQISPLS
jgi:hypothetical protein